MLEIKKTYSEKFIELYTDTYINGRWFKNIKSDALIIENAYKKAADMLELIESDSKKKQFRTRTLNKMAKGKDFALTLKQTSVNKLNFEDDKTLSLVKGLLDSIQIDDTQTFAFKGESSNQILSKEIVQKSEFVFQRYNKNFYVTSSNGTLYNEIIIPFNNEKYSPVNCITNDKLPKFYKKYTN